MYADIIVDISQEQLDKTFQYRIPPELENEVQIGVMVQIPFGRGNRLLTGYVIGIGSTPKIPAEKIKDIDSVSQSGIQAVGRMIQLAAWLKKQYGSTMNQALKTVLPVKEKVRQKEKKTVRLAVSKEKAAEYLALYEKKNAVARVRLLKALCKTDENGLDTAVLKEQYQITTQTIQALEKQNVITVETQELYRNPVRETAPGQERLILNEAQQKAVTQFCTQYDAGERKPWLLYGVTGSGKTLCYIEMIQHVTAQGKQAIVLIPEIALTFQTVQRFYRRFGSQVSVLHSRMSKGERYDQFLRAMRGEISIMIGPRSALFTPFTNLGLIIMDEEHEGAYKSEQAPRYHARETAVHIAKMCGAGVVFGSATPSVEAFYRAKKNEYTLLELPRRASGTLPAVYTVDLREELKCGNRSVFSRRLQELIQRRLAAKEQAKSAVEHFKEDFIYKIRSAIKEAYQRRDELNRIISRLDFGKDKYQFVITKNKGPDGRYYKMFMDDSLSINPSQLSDSMENQMNLFTMEHDEEYGDMMNELINIFIPPEDATREELDTAKKNMEKYADYRTYLSFDMQQIIHGEKDMKIGLSKMIKKNSGGEGQNPLYIALLASFAQVYRINLSPKIRRPSTIRLVVLDEAFSKMDAEKVASCISLIRGLGFQAIISATNDKIQNYLENVDKTFVYANPNKKHISIQEFEKVEYDQLKVEE